MRRSYTYEFPRPGVTADCVLFAMRPADLAVLLIQRKHAPFKGAWALPGGFVNENEPLERAAARELLEETGVTGVVLEPLGAFGDPGRDPRGHVVTAVFYSFLVADIQPSAADDAAQAAWFPLHSIALPSSRTSDSAAELVPLAFDHGRVIDAARRRLQERLLDPGRQAPFGVVPARFTLTELQRVYESVFGKRLQARSFRARLLARGLVEPVTPRSSRRAARGERERPSELFRLYRFAAPWLV